MGMVETFGMVESKRRTRSDEVRRVQMAIKRGVVKN